MYRQQGTKETIMKPMRHNKYEDCKDPGSSPRAPVKFGGFERPKNRKSPAKFGGFQPKKRKSPADLADLADLGKVSEARVGRTLVAHALCTAWAADFFHFCISYMLQLF